eukprot:gene6019-6257_t
MAALALSSEDAGVVRLGTATVATGGAITRLLSTGASCLSAARPEGDLLLAATLHSLAQATAAKQVKTFKTTKRGFSQRKDLIKQSTSSRNFTHKVSMLSAAAASAVRTGTAQFQGHGATRCTSSFGQQMEHCPPSQSVMTHSLYLVHSSTGTAA